MTAPAVGSVAQELYDELLPVAYGDSDATGWPLLVYAGGIGETMQEVNDLASDTDAGPGWSALLDVDRCPGKALPWLAQFVGVTLSPDGDEAAHRQEIRDHVGFRRGTVGLLHDLILPTLTGAKTVMIRERDTSAYHLSVVTYTAETPGVTDDTWATIYSDFATWEDVLFARSSWEEINERGLHVNVDTLHLIEAWKPAGLVVRYAVNDAQDWYEVWNDHCTWQQVYDQYATWQAVYVAAPVPNRCVRPRVHWLETWGDLYTAEATWQDVYDDYETW